MSRSLPDSIDSPHGSRLRFRRVKAPTSDELTQLTHTIAHRVARYLERQGLLVRDAGNSYLTRPPLSTKRLSLTRHGKVRYEFKTPYNDGTTHVLFGPLDFMYRM